jgi:hypothetical protein
MPKKTFTPSNPAGDNSSKRQPNSRPQFRQLSDDSPTWDDIPADLLHACICMLTTQGASPTLGYTRNGRSLTFAVWYKGDRDIQYLSGRQEVAEYAMFLAREWFRLSDEELAEYGLGPSLLA